MPSSHPLPPSCHWFSRLASALDPRSAPRLAWLLVGAILARGRRTVTSWIRAAGLSREYRPCYTTVTAAGRRADSIAARLLHTVVKPLIAGADRLTFAIGLANSQIVNTTAAQSRIRDANIAEESANMTKYNILTQSGIAALGQANQSSSMVLSLLR